MPGQFICQACGRLIHIGDAERGSYIQCPHCDVVVPVPASDNMELIEFACLACGSSFRVPVKLAGKKTSCPDCKATLTVPSPPAKPLTEESPEHIPFWDEEPSTAFRAPTQSAKTAGSHGSGAAFLVAGGALMLLLAGFGILYLINRGESDTFYDVAPRASYSPNTDQLTLKNASVYTWKDLIVEIQADSASYTLKRPRLVASGETIVIQMEEFSSPDNRRLDPIRTPPTKLILHLALSEAGVIVSQPVEWPAPPPSPTQPAQTPNGY